MSDGIDINAQLNLMGFGRNSSSGEGGGSAAAEGVTHEETLTKAVNTGVQQAVKALSNIIGLPLNSDIEGKSALAGFDPQSAMNGGQLSSMAVIRPESGGGWLSMLLDMIKRHLTRDIPGGGGAADGGGGGGGGGGDAFDSGGGGSSAGMGGGADFSGQPIGAPDMPDIEVNYGGKMMSADLMVTNLGNLRPDATPGSSTHEHSAGIE